MAPPTWQSYQSKNLRRDRPRHYHILLPLLVVSVITLLLFRGAESFGAKAKPPHSVEIPQAANSETLEPLVSPPVHDSVPPLAAPASLKADLRHAVIEELSRPRLSRDAAQATVERPMTVDFQLQAFVQDKFRETNPLYGAAVVLDATSGDVLAMADFKGKGARHDLEFLPTRAVFPAASVFKIVTAAAGIDRAGVMTTTPLKTVGNPYRLNATKLSSRSLRRARSIELSGALARSDNVAFAYLTSQYLNPQDLRDTAFAFGFDRPLAFALPVERSQTFLPEGQFAFAKASTGLSENSMSPLHGALIAAAVSNGGRAVSPRLFQDEPTAEKREAFIEIPRTTAFGLATMMKRTITNGTARKAFRGYERNAILSSAEIGGKTGTLTSDELKGHCEWFVGFAKRESRNVALGIVVIERPRHPVKPSKIARSVFEASLRSFAQSEQPHSSRKVAAHRHHRRSGIHRVKRV